MGLFDKIKDLFTDEEEVYETKEIEIEEKEEEHKLPTFMRNKIEKEERAKQKEFDILDKKSEQEEIAVLVENPSKPKKEERKFPFEFDDDDFIDTTNYSRVAISKEKVKEKNNDSQIPVIKPYSNKKEMEKPKKFRPTPVISPVYGVLDKNYKKEEVVSKDEDSYTIQRASKKVDFESVRKKAYGTLTDDIKANMCENCELLKEIKVNKKIERLTEEDLLYNMTVDEEVEKINEESILSEEISNNADLTIEEVAENYEDFGVEYEIPPQRSGNTDEVKIVNHAEEDVVVEKVEVKEIEDEEQVDVVESLDNKTEDLELTDDLFNLIDSMYKERND